MTPDTNAPTVEMVLDRSYAIGISHGSRAFIDRRVAKAIASETERRTTHRRWCFRRPALLAVSLLAVSGLVTAVGAGTNIIRLEWGSLPDQQRTPAQINVEIAAAMQTTPVPPGFTFPPLSVPDDHSVWGSYGGQGMVEFNAICAWYGDWTSAFRVGDKDRLARDRAMMGEILTWKTIADPFLADDSVRNGLRRLNSSADTGDPKPIDEFRTNNCSAS